MSEDLIARFIGIDLISNVANDIGYGVNRLAGRINSLSSASSQQLRAMQRAQQDLRDTFTANNDAMAISEAVMAGRVSAASTAVRDGRLEVDALENEVANRRSLRSSAEIRMAKEVQSAEDALVIAQKKGLGDLSAANALATARQEESSLRNRNALLNEADTRKLVAANGQINALQQVQASETSTAAQMEDQNRLTRAYQAEALHRQEIVDREAAEEIASRQRLVSALTSAGTLAVFGGAALIGVAAAIGGGLAVAADHAAHFEQQLLLIQTQAGASVAEVNLMRTATMELGPQFGFTAQAAATAAFHIESVGIRGAAAVDVLKASMQGARIGAANLEDVTNMLSVIMASGFIKGVSNATTAMATLDAIIGQGNIRMDQLAGAFRTGLIGAMQVAGVSLKDTGAALATLTDLGYTGATAGTALRSALTMIAAPTNVATKLLKDLGFSVQDVTSAQNSVQAALFKTGINVTQFAETVRTQGIAAGLELLKTKMQEAGLSSDQMSAVITKAFGGSRIGSAFKVLFENLDRLNLREAAIAKNATVDIFAQKWQATSDLVTTKVGQLESSLNNLVIVIGEAVTPTVVQWLGKVEDILSPLLEWTMANQNLIAQFAPWVVGALAIAGAILVLLGGLTLAGTAVTALATGVAAFSGPAIFVFGILAALAAALPAGIAFANSEWKKLSGFWDGGVVPAAKRLWNTLQDIWKVIQQALKDVMPLFQAAFDQFGDTLSKHNGLWQDITSAFSQFSHSVLDFVKSKDFATMVADIAVTLPAALKVAFDALVLFADEVQIAFTLLIGNVKVAIDLASGNMKQASSDIDSTSSEIGRLLQRTATDTDAFLTDSAKMTSATNQAAWQKVFDDTMGFTSKLNDEGVPKYGKVLDNYMAMTKDKTTGMRNLMFTQGVDVGAAMSDGVEAGLVRQQKALEASMARMAIGAKKAAMDASRAASPSELFAKDVGENWTLGMIVGAERKAPELNQAMQHIVTAAVPQSLPTMGGMATPAAQPVVDVLQSMSAQLGEMIQVLREMDKTSQQAPGTVTGKPVTDGSLLADLQAVLSQAQANRNRGVFSYSGGR